MVKQQRFSSMSPEVKKRTREAVTHFGKHVCSVDNLSGHGILKMSDARGRKRTLYAHQVIAAKRLVDQHAQTQWSDRKASLLAIHEVGSGKTITAILSLAAIHAINPYRDDAKMLVIVPVSVFDVWQHTLQAWTTLGDRILAANKQVVLTEEAIAKACIILTTPETLVTAYKTFNYIATDDEAKKKPMMQRWARGVAPTDTKRIAALKGVQPPVHPFFHLLERQPSAISAMVADELHRICNPTTQIGHLIGMIAKAATFNLGLTGTPASSKPSQIAHLARALDAQPDWLQKTRHFFLAKDGADRSLCRPAVSAFHEHLVDRVDASFLDLPDRKCLIIEYDPFVGLRPNGQIDAEAITRHNETLSSAQRLVASTAPAAPQALDSSQWGEEQRAAFSAIVALGNFEFSSVLGVHGAEAFRNDRLLFAQAAAQPSQTMQLIARIVQSRQSAGHERIAVFCESTTQLEILKLFLSTKPVGKLFLFDGSLSAKQRGDVVRDFLKCPMGVMLFSSAGSIGITLCPGCEVLLSVGSLPWNATTIDQAFGRVYRIGQNKPVEIIQLAARRSVTLAKAQLHKDKRDRLGRAVTDEDYSQFVDGDNTWRQTRRILTSCVPLDKNGNYQVPPDDLARLRAYRKQVEQCDANGVPPPPAPPGLPQRPKLANRVELPAVSYPRKC
jgi:SNF2 family DNA or RNA helicase